MSAPAEITGGGEQPEETIVDYVEQLDQSRDKLFAGFAAYADRPTDKRAAPLPGLSADFVDDFRACALYILETDGPAGDPHSQITGILLGEEQQRGQFLRGLTPEGNYVGKYDVPKDPEQKQLFNVRHDARRRELAGILREATEDDPEDDAFIEALTSLFVSNLEDDTEEFLEQAVTTPTARRHELKVALGNHALDVAKAAGGAMLGVLIMRQFGQKRLP